MDKANINSAASHISDKLSINRDEYMKARVVFKLNQYTEKSKRYRLFYHLTNTITIICSAIVPVLINLGVDNLFPTIFGLVVTILVSIEKLYHFREHWRNFDEIAAFLRSEQVQFQTGAGQYKMKKSNPKRAFQLYVTRVERSIIEEREETIEMRTKDEE